MSKTKWYAKPVYLLVALALVLSLAIVALPMAGTVWATPDNWYVDGALGTDDGTHGTGPGANAFKTIQYAIDDGRVGNGDTINVAAGIYQEDITISKELTLQGAGRTTTTIQRNAEISQVVLIQADNVKIDGFKIDGGGSYPYPCDHMVSLSTAGSPPYENIEVSDCHLLHCNGAAIWFNGDPPGGLAVGTGYKINDNTIEYFAGDDCSVGTCQYRGIAVGKTLGLEIKRNTITNSNPWEYKGDYFTYGGYAIYLKDYTGGTIEDNVISKCLYGIVVNSNVAETWVNSNTITECHRGIVTGEVFAKIHITNNSITTRRDPGNPAHAKNVNEQGILIGGDGDWYDSSPPYAWQVDNLRHEVSGNTVTGTSTTDSFGLGVMPGWWDEDYGVSGTFTGNSISGYKYGMKVWGTYAPWDGSTEDKTGHVHVSFGFNNIVSCTTDAAVDGVWSRADGGIDAENNWWGAGTGPTSASAKYDCDPWLGTALEEVQSEPISGSGTIQDTPTGGDITIDATGNHTITAAKYAENPGGPCPFTNEGSYYDVHLDDATNVTSLTIQFCPAHENEVICYWDGSSWVQASNQVYSGGCILVTITDETQPSLSDLTGLPFGQGFPIPVGGEAYPVNKFSIVAPWIAVAVLLGSGSSWYFLRRRRSQG